jgi:hypothetical protein
VGFVLAPWPSSLKLKERVVFERLGAVVGLGLGTNHHVHEVEAGQDGRWKRHVVFERLGAVVRLGLGTNHHVHEVEAGQDGRWKRHVVFERLGAVVRLGLGTNHHVHEVEAGQDGRWKRHVVFERLGAVVRLGLGTNHHVHEVEAGQDGRWKRHVVFERLGAVVAPASRVGGGQDARARVQRRLHARLGDGDGLLLHRLVDRHLRHAANHFRFCVSHVGVPGGGGPPRRRATNQSPQQLPQDEPGSAVQKSANRDVGTSGGG